MDGLRHQKEKRSMDHFAGLNVSVKETSVCIVNDTGKIVRDVKVASGHGRTGYWLAPVANDPCRKRRVHRGS